MSKVVAKGDTDLTGYMVKLTLNAMFLFVFLLFLWKIMYLLGWFITSGAMAKAISTQINNILQGVPGLGPLLKWLAEHRNVGV